MGLVQALLNDSVMESSIDPAKYSHDTGAMRIAMESVEELHEIFIESFYNVEQAELAATTEGVDLVGSDYEAAFEASIKGTFAKVKEFIQKLWDKVKAWFHNVKRFISSLFMSGKKFVKKYEKDIKEAKLRDFIYKMYKYTNIDDAGRKLELFDIGAKMRTLYNKVRNMGDDTEIYSSDNTEIKAYIEPEEVFKRNSENKATNAEEFAAWVFGYFRDGAKDENDKMYVSITSLSSYVDAILDDSAMSDLDTLAKKTDDAYKGAITMANDFEKSFRELSNDESRDSDSKRVSSNQAEYERFIAEGLSREQSVTNTMMNAWKTALTERNNVYMQLIMAGLSNSRKATKSGKKES